MAFSEILTYPEEKKFISFYGITQKFLEKSGFNANTVVDCCCGNSFLGWYWLLENPGSRVIAIDNKLTKRHSEIRDYFVKKHPELSEWHRFMLTDITKSFDFPEKCAVMAVHACGNLTDRIIEQSIKQGVPFSVMPCCYNRRQIWWKDSNVDFQGDFGEYADNLRIFYALKKGYSAEIKTAEGTPMNRVITAFPEDF